MIDNASLVKDKIIQAKEKEFELDLSRSNLKGIPVEVFDLKSLKILSLSGNSLGLFSRERLDLLTPKSQPFQFNLKFVHNRITTKFQRLINIFKNQNKVETTYLKYLPITELGIYSKNLKHLTHLDLSFNQLDTFPDFIVNLTGLTSLKLSHNQLKEIPSSIEKLTNLTHLDLSGNKLKSLPDSLVNLTNLTDLNLNTNQFEHLPNSIGNFPNLICLDLRSNLLKDLPSSIGNLATLTDLYLNSNRVEYLPNSIGNLSNLKSFGLSANYLESLPDSVGNLINLNRLNLTLNHLNKLPNSFGNLANLIALYLSNNRLNDLPQSFSNIRNLKKLDLLDNQFHSFPNVLQKHRSLTHLNCVLIPLKYQGMPLECWCSKWLLETKNAELRRLIIQVVGYEKICQELEAIELDNWREYTLLKIDKEIDIEPIHLLKMTCPSTGYIHILRVAPNLTSAREAIKWVNWGIDPEEFAIET